MPDMPRYHKLTLLLKEKLTSGEFKVGDRFFSQTELMKKYTLSFATVTRALKELEREGYIVRIQGRGTFVQSTEQNTSPAPGTSQTVCVFIPWDARIPSHINYRTLYRGMESSRLSSMQLKLIPYSMKPDDLEPFLFSREPIGGVIFVYPEAVHLSLIERFAQQHPVVVIGCEIKNQSIGCVWTDNKVAAEQAVQHLVDLGHRNIGIVSAPMAVSDAADRLDGYRATLKKNKLPPSESSVVFTNAVDLNGYSGCINLLGRNHDITALFAAGDVIAMGVFAAAKALGRDIPGDLAVVGFDDTDYAAEMIPALTTIHVPYENMAKRAIEVLARMIKTGKATRECLPAPLVIRGSTGSNNPATVRVKNKSID